MARTKKSAQHWELCTSIFAALAIFHHDELKKRMNRITATWRNGCFGKNRWSSGSHHTKLPTHQNGISPKNFCSNHPCSYCIWLVRHSSLSLNQQRRPLPLLPSSSFFYGTSLLTDIFNIKKRVHYRPGFEYKLLEENQRERKTMILLHTFISPHN